MKILIIASLAIIGFSDSAFAQNAPDGGGVSQGGYARHCRGLRQYDPDWQNYMACSAYDASSDYGGPYDNDDLYYGNYYSNYYSNYYGNYYGNYYSNYYSNRHYYPEHRVYFRSGVLK
jgi:hypothetical protein